MADRSPRPIFPIDLVDVSPQAAAAARDRDAHLGTLLIGIFVGTAISAAMMMFGAWVIA